MCSLSSVTFPHKPFQYINMTNWSGTLHQNNISPNHLAQCITIIYHIERKKPLIWLYEEIMVSVTLYIGGGKNMEKHTFMWEVMWEEGAHIYGTLGVPNNFSNLCKYN